jgi:hypothetical protein
MRTASLRCAGPLRNKQRVQDKKILRRELESFRREQVALRQEWEAAAGTLSLLALLVQTYLLLTMGSRRSRTPQSGIFRARRIADPRAGRSSRRSYYARAGAVCLSKEGARRKREAQVAYGLIH